VGKGKDAGALPEKDRASLRQQSLEWLRADLQTYRGLLDKDPTARPVIQERLAHWLKDDDFASLRGMAAIDRLPEGERQPWRQLWADVEALRQRTQDK
jgi:hypothetical protein